MRDEGSRVRKEKRAKKEDDAEADGNVVGDVGARKKKRKRSKGKKAATEA